MSLMVPSEKTLVGMSEFWLLALGGTSFSAASWICSSKFCWSILSCGSGNFNLASGGVFGSLIFS